jgi:predicted metalloprotease with PDZ domain
MRLAWLCVAAFCLTPSATEAAEYTIRSTAGEFPTVTVVAHLRSKSCTFRTSDHWADFFPDDKRGWFRFISDVSATQSGKPVKIEAVDHGFHVSSAAPCELSVQYKVDFAFGRQQWPSGNEQVAYTDASAIYTTGLPLFLLDDDAGPSTIKFELPADWRVATPWEPIARDRYRARDREALLSNTLVFGRAFIQTFDAQNFHVTVALLGNLAPSATLVSSTFTALVPDFTDMFGDKSPGRYMVALIPGPEDGESYTDSFAVATSEAPTELNKIVWANHLAHELLHYWMGGKISSAESDTASLEWFTEGFTEYLANRALADENIYSEEQFLDRMGRHLGAYVMTRENPNFQKVTPIQSGAHKWANRPLVYSGGATIGFCLDGRIRKASGGKRSLRDVMRALYRAQTVDHKPLTLRAIANEASRAAGQSLDDFFKRHVEGTDALDLKACAADHGLVARVHNNDVFLTRR